MYNSILITGANGFVGNAICNYLNFKKMSVKGVIRYKSKVREKNIISFNKIETINGKTNWYKYLKNIDVVVHTAGYAKFPLKSKKNISLLFDVNVEGTINLARQAEEMGVKKLIYISSIRVHGDGYDSNEVVNEKSKYKPNDQYALSKLKAEQELEKFRKISNLDVIIIRPTLIYGKGLKSNLVNLISLVNKGVPLPFKSIKNNKISLLSINNLNTFIYECIVFKKLLNTSFVLSDDKAISTNCLIKIIACALEKKVKLFNFPKKLIYIIGILLNKKKSFLFLLKNLEVDNSFSKSQLNWRPKNELHRVFKEIING